MLRGLEGAVDQQRRDWLGFLHFLLEPPKVAVPLPGLPKEQTIGCSLAKTEVAIVSV